MRSGLLVIGLCCLALFGYGQNYQIQKSTFNAGGGTSASTSYKIIGSIGDPGTDTASSVSYKLTAGFFPIGFNEPPTDILMTSQDIDENLGADKVVGIFSTTDPEINDSHSYTLVSGTGDTDNASFSIVGEKLRTINDLDFEIKNSYSIRVRTDDGDGGTYEEVFVITVNNTNDPPTNLTLDTIPVVDENLSVGALVVAIAGTEDQDISSAGDTHTYSLPAGVLDNDFFQISDTSILTNEIFDFEDDPTYKIRIRTTDSEGGFFEKNYIVTIKDANDPPTDFVATPTSPGFIFVENLPVGSALASLSSIDEDAVDTHTYSLVAGAGDTDNAFFQIAGNELQVLQNLDYDRAQGKDFSLRIQTQDATGDFFSKSVAISLSNEDEAPTDVKFVGAVLVDVLNVSEDVVNGTPLAFLAAIDEDTSDFYDPGNLRHSYELTPGVIDNATFSISNNLLSLNGTLVFSIKSIYDIVVRVKDLDNLALSYDDTLRINVIESGGTVNSDPTDITLSNLMVLDNAIIDDSVGTLTTTDENDAPGDLYSYTLVGGAGSTDNASFSILNDKLRVNTALDATTKNQYFVRIRTTDPIGGAYEKEFVISVAEFVSSPPSDISLSSYSVDETATMGTSVGTFSAIDADANESFTYDLVAGVGDTDNASFSIAVDELLTNTTFDFLIKSEYSIRVRVTDNSDSTYDEVLAITILDKLDPSLSSLLPMNAAIDVDKTGNFQITFNEAVNPNAGEVHLYETVTDSLIASIDVTSGLVTGAGTTTISIDPTNDLEGNLAYHVTIDSAAFADLANNAFSGWSDNTSWAFTTANTDPSDILLSATSIDDTIAIGTTVGMLSAVDADSNQTFDYALVAGLGDVDNVSFNVVGNELRTTIGFDFLVKDSYSVRVRVTDNFGGAYEEMFVITIIDTRAPNIVALSPVSGILDVDTTGNLSIVFNEPVNTGSAEIILYDSISSARVEAIPATSSLVTGSGTSTIVIDPSEKLDGGNSYYVTIEEGAFLDMNGNSFLGWSDSSSWTFTTKNNSPTDIQLSSTSINETDTLGTPVGTFSSTDEDPSATFTYTLVAGTGDTDNALFRILEDELLSDTTFDFLIKSNYSVRIQVIDNLDSTFEKSFNITVLDTREPLFTFISPVSGSVDVDKASNLAIKFNEPVVAGIGDIVIYDFSSEAVVETITASSDVVFGLGTDSITVNLVNDLDGAVEYYVTIENTAFKDSSDNEFLGWSDKTSWTFITENASPSDIYLSSTTVAETDTIGTTVGRLSAEDEDPNQTFTYSLIDTIGNTDNQSFNIIGDTLITDTTFNFLIKSEFLIRVRVADNYDSTFEKTFMISALDTRAPNLISLSPATGSIDVDKTGDLTMAFNEAINASTGNIVIRETISDAIIETIAATSVMGLDTETIVIDLENDLKGGLQYYITVDNIALTDQAGNVFEGWTDKTSWEFTTFDDEAPVIVLTTTPEVYLTEGASTDAAVSVTDASTVTVKFHAGGIMKPASGLPATTVSLSGGNYTSEISGDMFDDVGLQYFFTAEDVNGNVSSTDTMFMYLSLTIAETIESLKFGGGISDYQIISIPYKLKDNKILSIFSDFGPYNKNAWRILKYNNSSGSYDDFPVFTTLEIGKGYWFNAVSKSEVLLTERDFPEVNNSEGYAMTLSLGWNLIGNPFTVDIDWKKVLEDNQITDEVEPLWVYESGPNLETSDNLKAFRGGFVKASKIITLNILPSASSAARRSQDAMLTNMMGDDPWIFPLTLKKDQYEYKSGYIGMHPEAKEGKDQYDLTAAPRFIKHLDYHFNNDNAQSEIQAGYVTKLEKAYVWEFSVETDLEPGKVSLNWPMDRVGDNTVYLFDSQRQKLIDMSTNEDYEFVLSGPQKFKVFYNTPVEEINPELTLLGEPYPNPTTGDTYIPVVQAASGDQKVDVRVYSLTGTEVDQIFNGTLDNGFHELKWDARNSSGQKVSSGMYIVRLIIEDDKNRKVFTQRIAIN